MGAQATEEEHAAHRQEQDAIAAAEAKQRVAAYLGTASAPEPEPEPESMLRASVGWLAKRKDKVVLAVSSSPLAVATRQLGGVAGVAVEGMPQPDFNGVYLPAGDHEGWPRFESAEGKHLFRSLLRDRWYIAPTFDRDGKRRTAEVDDKTPGELCIGHNVWRVLHKKKLQDGHVTVQVLTVEQVSTQTQRLRLVREQQQAQLEANKQEREAQALAEKKASAEAKVKRLQAKVEQVLAERTPSAGEHKQEPEPEPATTDPLAKTHSGGYGAPDASGAALVRTNTGPPFPNIGISLAGLLSIVTQFADVLDDTVTTSDVCHLLIKPLTCPAGYRNVVTATDLLNSYYSHSYTHEASGREQADAPPGTQSWCERLRLDPETAGWVGRPTVFLSHAWQFSFTNVVEAVRRLVESQPPGAPPVFVWFDVCSIDEHATQGFTQEVRWPHILACACCLSCVVWWVQWWSTTFRDAIKGIGHTAMVLSPWHDPLPLTRAWCLWEVFCTVDAGAEFSVCLGPAEEAAFEAALLQRSDVVLETFARIDVEKAEAGSPDDLAMILKAAREAEGGTEGINAVACERLRAWVLDKLRALAARHMGPGGALATEEAVLAGQHVAVVLAQAGLYAEVRRSNHALPALIGEPNAGCAHRRSR
eukprot:COSAG04_NODE_612_length_11991_cov_17.359569_3_plen_646_part_00